MDIRSALEIAFSSSESWEQVADKRFTYRVGTGVLVMGETGRKDEQPWEMWWSDTRAGDEFDLTDLDFDHRWVSVDREGLLAIYHEHIDEVKHEIELHLMG